MLHKLKKELDELKMNQKKANDGNHNVNNVFIGDYNSEKIKKPTTNEKKTNKKLDRSFFDGFKVTTLRELCSENNVRCPSYFLKDEIVDLVYEAYLKGKIEFS